MKIYTKTGDDGTTMLFGGGRVTKAHLRIESYGTIDELNSFIGLLCSNITHPNSLNTLNLIQNQLFIIGSNLAANPQKKQLKKPDIAYSAIELLETEIDQMQTQLPELNNFILPGGHLSASYCHVARCICRRAERIITALAAHEPVEPIIIQYINRLSDYLFVLARFLNYLNKHNEIIWNNK